MERQLSKLWNKGQDFLGVELPISGAMTWISDPQLVSLMSNLGAFGVLAAGNMPPEPVRAEIRAEAPRAARSPAT